MSRGTRSNKRVRQICLTQPKGKNNQEATIRHVVGMRHHAIVGVTPFGFLNLHRLCGVYQQSDGNSPKCCWCAQTKSDKAGFHCAQHATTAGC